MTTALALRSANGSVAAMKLEIAERLAATKVEGLSVADARLVIREFLTQLTVCPVCADDGKITAGQDINVDVAVKATPHRSEPSFIPQGTEMDCPRCGPTGTDGSQGDPDWIGWHCTRGDSPKICQQDRQADNGRREPHQACGRRIMVPPDVFAAEA